MQRIACWTVTCFAVALIEPAAGQIITAQPARNFNPSGQYTATYPPAYVDTTLDGLMQSPEANSIRGWYRDYLGRDVGQDLTGLVKLLRGGMSTTDLQATILGSDEFFTQKGRDPQTFVRDTLQAVTWSEPPYADVQRWTERLNQLRGDRFALAREILLAGNSTQPQAPTVQFGDVAARLSSAAQLAVQTIDFEIGNTPQGRQANLQAQALMSAANQLQSVVGGAGYRLTGNPYGATATPYGTTGAAYGGSGTNDPALALANVDRAYQALQATLSNPPGTAPSAAGVVRRIGTMVADAHNAIAPATVQPVPGYQPTGSVLPPGAVNTIPATMNPAAGSQQLLLDQIAAARRAAESLIQTLTGQSAQDYAYNSVLRDLDSLASRLASLDPLVRSGAPRDRIQWEVQNLGDSAGRVNSQLGATRLPYTAQLYWQSLQSSLAQLRDTVGIAPAATAAIIPAAPPGAAAPMLRPTAFHESLLPLLDLAASQIDVFVAGTTPLVYSFPDVPAIQADARSLKNRVMSLRQQTAAGQPASVLKQSLSGMIGDYVDAFNRWNRDVAASRLANPAPLSPVGETLNRVEQAINQALASGELTPTGPSRATQDLAQLTAEVNAARQSVAAFAGYQQQQAIDLYLQQLAGYAQQTGDALTRQTSTDARRLAVGMQGVIGRMQPEIDALNRSLAAAAPLARQQGGDLQLRADRIGRLVDDVESQLY